jgi:hypothetical protein
LIRKATGLAERADESLSRFGEQLKEALQQFAGGYHPIQFQRANAQSGLADVIFTGSPRECLP